MNAIEDLMSDYSNERVNARDKLLEILHKMIFSFECFEDAVSLIKDFNGVADTRLKWIMNDDGIIPPAPICSLRE